MKDCRLGPCTSPDYNVNLLTLDEDGLYEWTQENDVQTIIDGIKKKEAIAIDPRPHRIAKIATKEYTLV